MPNAEQDSSSHLSHVIRAHVCKDCHRHIHQQMEKAVGNGEWQGVWTDDDDSWVCEVTGDEHRATKRFTVTVLHNVSRDMFLHYSPETSKLYHAHTFTDIDADTPEDAANVVWMLANVDDADNLTKSMPNLSRYAPQVTEYRRRRNRSLSVSDVLIIRGTEDTGRFAGRTVDILSVEMLGHSKVTHVPPFADSDLNSETSASYEALQTFIRNQR